MDHLTPFVTPVFVEHLPGVEALAPGLAAMFVAESKATPGIVRSNAGGWHSVPDLTHRPVAPVQQMFRALVDHTERVVDAMAEGRPRPRFRYGVQAWAMVYGTHDYGEVHDHAEAHLSGVCYLDAGDGPAGDERSGRLSLLRPGTTGATIPGVDVPSTFTVTPRAGLVVMWPGYVQHHVHPYRGVRPRVAVAFNVRCEPVGPAR
ncbi:MAG: putative 2OG-Fe(II) oxygenase [bacterium]